MEQTLRLRPDGPNSCGHSRLGLLLDQHNVDTQKAMECAGQLIAFAFETCVLCDSAKRCGPMLEAGCDVRSFCPNAGVIDLLPKHHIN